MDKLYQERIRLQRKKMMRYLRYVFNDHITAILFILFGGLALYYANWIKTLEKGNIAFLWLYVLLFTVLLSVGKLATYLQRADMVFLLPKTYELPKYLQKAKKQSYALPAVVLILAFVAYLPLLFTVHSWSIVSLILLGGQLLLLKAIDLIRQEKALFSSKEHAVYYYLFAAITLAISVIVSPLFGFVATILLFVIQWAIKDKEAFFQWEKAVQYEEKRMQRIYRFFALFTDVPDVTTKVKRRAYFDPWLNRMKKDAAHTYDYLYWRELIRNNEYIGLFIRLTLITLLFLWLRPSKGVLIIGAMAFLYLLLLQIQPIRHAFDYVLAIHLYPVKEKEQQAALQRIYFWISFAFAVPVAAMSWYVADIATAGIVFILLLLEEVVLYRLSWKKKK